MPELTKIQHEIHEILEKYQSLKIVESHLDEINKQLSKANAELNDLDKKVNKELADWEALEKTGVKTLFYKVLGSKEQQIEKERQEYLEISLKYNEYKKSVELMEFEKNLLQGKTDALPKLEANLEKLKKLREFEILNDDNIKLKKQYQALLQKIDNNRLLKRELGEAVVTGSKAFEALKVTRSHLKQAIQWGQWDMAGRKGGMSAHMKHGAIDKANRAANRAQHDLNLFKRELADIDDGHVNFELHIEGFSKFTDFFFDNLISDWIIQQKIKNSLSNVEATMDKVKRIVDSVDHEVKIIQKEFIALEGERDALLIS